MWEPIAAGERERQVWRAIDEIAEELAGCSAPAADLAVFWSYLADARDTDITHMRRDAAIEQLAAELERGYDSLALVRGLAGAGWAAAHLSNDVDELLESIDEQLLAPAAWQGPFDLVRGVAGFAVYFLEREGEAADRALARVVDHFAATAERQSTGIAWPTAPAHLAEHARARWPDGAYDCGVAHGTAGVIGVLLRIAGRAGAPAAAATLAAEATSWLLAQGRDGRFPSFVRGEHREPARVGWCYGAPGIALALRRPELAEWIDPPRVSEDLVGPGICHGTASRLHAVHRAYQATRNPAHLAAALGWLDRLLATPRPLELVETGERRAALLSGLAGVALALLATVSDIEPAWDRRYLCDLSVS